MIKPMTLGALALVALLPLVACASGGSEPEDLSDFADRFTDAALKAMESPAEVENMASFYAEDVENVDVRSGESAQGRDEALEGFRYFASSDTDATIDYVVTGDGWFSHRVVAKVGTTGIEERWVIISEVEDDEITRQVAVPVLD